MGVNGHLRVEKVTSRQIKQNFWAIYTVSWHTIGNLTHFKEISLK